MQSGIIAGKENLVKEIKNDPLFRTYRCSPLILFELQNTVNKYIDKNEMSIPIWSSLLMKYEELLARVDDISKKISIDHKIFDSESLIGGGTMPDKKLLTPAIGIPSKNIDEDLRILSNQEIPLIPRISEDKIIELHGNSSYASCLDCKFRYELDEIKSEFISQPVGSKKSPICKDCSGIIKSATISFGQPMPEKEMQRAESATLDCDLFLAIGNSVYTCPIRSTIFN